MRLKLPALNRTRSVLVRVPILLTALIFLFLSFSPTEAGLYDDLDRIQKQINATKAKITQLQKEEDSLVNQIAYLDNQIYLTQLEIEEAETEIKLLSGDIGDLSQRLERISSFLELQEETFITRARSAYVADQLSSFDIILGSENLDEAIRQIKYLKVLEAQDREVLEQMRDIRLDYNAQRTNLEEKKADVEELKKTVEAKKASLESQQNDKEYLLAVTQNQEATYRKLLQALQAEQQEILRAIEKLGVKLGKVNGGDVIAFEGNTGCVLPRPSSSCPTCGSHLHFGIALVNPSTGKVVRWVDPLKYLPGTGSGKLMGKWKMYWPEGNASRITSGYGWRRIGGTYHFHTAIDIAVRYGNPIKAAAKGTAYFSVGSCAWCPWPCNGKPAGRIVEHGTWNGYIVRTFYWHVRR